jgi:hypothetical protein
VQIQRLEAQLATAPPGKETDEYRERLRMLRGVLQFRLDEAFKARVWQQRRAIRDLDLALVEAQNRWVRVQHARKIVPSNTGEFAARIAALQTRIVALQGRLVSTRQRQNDYLAGLAVQQLEDQKTRLAAYRIQARYELAAMYDRAQSAAQGDKPKESPAPEQKP